MYYQMLLGTLYNGCFVDYLYVVHLTVGGSMSIPFFLPADRDSLKMQV